MSHRSRMNSKKFTAILNTLSSQTLPLKSQLEFLFNILYTGCLVAREEARVRRMGLWSISRLGWRSRGRRRRKMRSPSFAENRPEERQKSRVRYEYVASQIWSRKKALWIRIRNIQALRIRIRKYMIFREKFWFFFIINYRKLLKILVFTPQSILNIEGHAKVMQRCKRPIHISTLESFVCLSLSIISMLIILKNDYFHCGFSKKVTCGFLLQENTSWISELNTFKLRKKRQYLPWY